MQPETPDGLPQFRYHPNPLVTGSIQQSPLACECCGKTRGYVNTCNFYSTSGREHFCPWCISTGRAATEFDGIFCDDFSLVRAGLPAPIVEEVSQRTPGFSSSQSEVWLSCCGDACEYHGDASIDEINNLSAGQFNQLQAETGLPLEKLQVMVENYMPASSTTFYKWKCRVCRSLKYYVDHS